MHRHTGYTGGGVGEFYDQRHSHSAFEDDVEPDYDDVEPDNPPRDYEDVDEDVGVNADGRESQFKPSGQREYGRDRRPNLYESNRERDRQRYSREEEYDKNVRNDRSSNPRNFRRETQHSNYAESNQHDRYSGPHQHHSYVKGDDIEDRNLRAPDGNRGGRHVGSYNDHQYDKNNDQPSGRMSEYKERSNSKVPEYEVNYENERNIRGPREDKRKLVHENDIRHKRDKGYSYESENAVNHMEAGDFENNVHYKKKNEVPNGGYLNQGYEHDNDSDLSYHRPKVSKALSMRLKRSLRRRGRSYRGQKRDGDLPQISFADGMKTLIQRRRSHRHPLENVQHDGRSQSGIGSEDYYEDLPDNGGLPSSKETKKTKSLHIRLVELKKKGASTHDMANFMRNRLAVYLLLV